MKTAAIFGALLLAASASRAVAKTECSVEALNALHVAGVQVTQATATAATGTVPAHCAVLGTMDTNGDGAPPGAARFALQLPEVWQQRFSSWASAGTPVP
jgi:hypothetical protein